MYAEIKGDDDILMMQKEMMGIDHIQLQVDRYLLASSFGRRKVWVQSCEWDKNGKAQKWIVVDGKDSRSYMFKDSGCFGYTENPDDKFKNSFATASEAARCFREFWSK